MIEVARKPTGRPRGRPRKVEEQYAEALPDDTVAAIAPGGENLAEQGVSPAAEFIEAAEATGNEPDRGTDAEPEAEPVVLPDIPPPPDVMPTQKPPPRRSTAAEKVEANNQRDAALASGTLMRRRMG